MSKYQLKKRKQRKNCVKRMNFLHLKGDYKLHEMAMTIASVSNICGHQWCNTNLTSCRQNYAYMWQLHTFLGKTIH